jgi:hypothetical protein
MAPVKPLSPVGADGQARQDAGTWNGWTSNETDHEALAMRLARMTTRRWMVVVAVVAPILFSARLLSLSAMYRDRADRYEVDLMGATPIIMGPRERYRIVPTPSARLVRARELADKYRRASWCHWLPVEPDPPEP